MIVLTDGEQAARLTGRVPELAMRCAEGLSPGGMVLVLEEGDDIEKDVPQAGRHGLMSHLDDEWLAPFDFVRFVVEDGRRVFEARLAYGKYPVTIVAPDAAWLDSRLRLVLDLEGEEASLEE